MGWMSCFQSIYISVPSSQFRPPDLPDILAVAREHNSKVGISGLLLFHGGSFVQVLEGPKADVEALLKRIAADPRHDKMKLLLQKDVEKKEFEEWSMGFVDSQSVASKQKGFLNLFTELTTLVREDTTAQRALRRFMDGDYRRFVES